MKTRVLECVTCGRLTQLTELAARPLPEVKGVKTTNRVGCAYCGAIDFKVRVTEHA